LPPLRPPLVVRVLDLEDRNKVVATRTLGVAISHPREYVMVTDAGFEAGGKPGTPRDRLAVRLRLRDTLAPPPCSATLAFAPDAEGRLPTYTDGTVRGNLPAGLEELTLQVTGVRAATPLQPTTTFQVGIDGWARAFVFRAALGRRGAGSLARRVDGPAVRLRLAGDYALTAPTFAVPVEVDGAPEGSTLEVRFGRIVAGAFRTDAEARRPTPWDQVIGFNPLGADGALVFTAAVRDWAVELDTSGITGQRELQARLLSRTGVELALAARTLTMGDSQPEDVRFVDPPARAWRMAPLPLRARGSDQLTGIKEVQFFVGKPVARKVPPGVKTVAGAPLDAERRTWGVKLPLPPDGKGPVDISVRFVNALGKDDFATTTVELLEKDPALTAPGKITGKVVRGSAPQPGLEVTLTDEKGAEKGQVTTKDDGTFAFEGVPPGKYRVSSVRRDYGYRGAFPRKAGEFITLEPGATATAEVVLFIPGG
jgi:hypothetical protein